MAGGEPTSQDFLQREVEESKTDESIKSELLSELAKAEEIKAKFGENSEVRKEYDDVRIATIGALRDLRISTSSDLDEVRKSLTGDIDFGQLREKGDISRDEAEKIKTKFDGLNKLNPEKKKTEELTDFEKAINVLQEKKLGFEYGEDLIEKGYTETHLHGYNKTEGNFAIAISDFEEKLKNEDPNQWNSLAVAHYFQMLESKGELSISKLITIMGVQNIVKLREIWTSPESKTAQDILKTNENTKEIFYGFENIPFENYLNTPTDFRQLSQIIDLLTPEERERIKEKIIWYLHGNPDKRDIVANIQLENEDTFLKEIVLEAQIGSYKEQFLNKISFFYTEIPDVGKIITAMITAASEGERNFNVNDFSFIGVNEIIQDHNTLYNPELPIFEGDLLTNIYEIIQSFVNTDELVKTLGNNFSSAKTQLEKRFSNLDEIFKNFDSQVQEGFVKNEKLATEKVEYDFRTPENEKAILENPTKLYEINKIDDYLYFVTQHKDTFNNLEISQLHHNLWQLDGNDGFSKESNFYKVIMNFPGKIDDLSFPNLNYFVRKNYSHQEDYKSFIEKIILQESGFKTLRQKLEAGDSDKQKQLLQDLATTIISLPNAREKYSEELKYLQIRLGVESSGISSDNIFSKAEELVKNQNKPLYYEISAFISDSDISQDANLQHAIIYLIQNNALSPQDFTIDQLADQDTLFDEKTLAQLFLQTPENIEKNFRMLPAQAQTNSETLTYIFQLFKANPEYAKTTTIFEYINITTWEETSRFMDVFLKTYEITLPLREDFDYSRFADFPIPIHFIEKTQIVLRGIENTQYEDIYQNKQENNKYLLLSGFLQGEIERRQALKDGIKEISSSEKIEELIAKMEKTLDDFGWKNPEDRKEFINIFRSGSDVLAPKASALINKNIPEQKREEFLRTIVALNIKISDAKIDDAKERVDIKYPESLPKLVQELLDAQNKPDAILIEKKFREYMNPFKNSGLSLEQIQISFVDSLHIGEENIALKYAIETIIHEKILQGAYQDIVKPENIKPYLAGKYNFHDYETKYLDGKIPASYENNSENSSNSSESQSPQEFKSVIAGYEFNFSGEQASIKIGENFVPLTESDKKILNSETEIQNFVSLYETFNKLKIEKIWPYKDQIIKAMGNRNGMQINRSNGDFIDAREMNVILSSLLYVTTQKEEYKTPSVTLEITQRNYSKETQVFGQEVIEGSIAGPGGNKIEDAFIQKFTRFNSGDKGWFDLPRFQKALDGDFSGHPQ